MVGLDRFELSTAHAYQLELTSVLESWYLRDSSRLRTRTNRVTDVARYPPWDYAKTL